MECEQEIHLTAEHVIVGHRDLNFVTKANETLNSCTSHVLVAKIIILFPISWIVLQNISPPPLSSSSSRAPQKRPRSKKLRNTAARYLIHVGTESQIWCKNLSFFFSFFSIRIWHSWIWSLSNICRKLWHHSLRTLDRKSHFFFLQIRRKKRHYC